MSTISPEARQELVMAVAARYRQSTPAERGRILDEFVALTGYHHKLDTDNGSEFLNEVLIGFCKEHDIELTRSRPYRKNDQAWVEQKNGAVVRRLVGYGRLEGMPGAEALAHLYSAARLFVNVFQPSFKLAEKTRVGARVHKRYPTTPTGRGRPPDSEWRAGRDKTIVTPSARRPGAGTIILRMVGNILK